MDSTEGAIRLFVGKDFNVLSAKAEAGEWNIDRLEGGVGENTVSSIKVATGYAVTLYSERDLTGDSKEFTADAAYVGDDFNDRASSLKVSPRAAARSASTSSLVNPGARGNKSTAGQLRASIKFA
ncbi:hypothetical protein [Streptomyces sp. NPDC048357]|uniref:hypothetical protein n=1 Tax=Streptomyces sp. NPDC048357 TaxID=3154719 RepID=UPI003447C0C2